MKNDRSIMQNVVGVMLLLVAFPAQLFAMQFAWNEILPRYVPTVRHLSIWNVFVGMTLFGLLLLPSNVKTEELDLLKSGLTRFFIVGLSWFVLWMVY